MIDMHGCRKQRKIFHMNMLREFCQPSDTTAVGYWYWCEEACHEVETNDQGEIPVWQEESAQSEAGPTFSEQLNAQQGDKLAERFRSSLQ